jgi:hypothetical protein
MCVPTTFAHPFDESAAKHSETAAALSVACPALLIHGNAVPNRGGHVNEGPGISL